MSNCEDEASKIEEIWKGRDPATLLGNRSWYKQPHRDIADECSFALTKLHTSRKHPTTANESQ